MRNAFQEEVYQDKLTDLNQAIKDAEESKEKAIEDLTDKWDAVIEDLEYDRNDFVAREANGGYEE